MAFCPNPPEGGDWKISKLLQTILDEPECQQKKCTLVVVTGHANLFNHSVLHYYRVRDFPEARLTIRPIQGSRTLSKNSTKIFYQPTLGWITSDYLVYIPQFKNWYSYADAVVKVIKNETHMHPQIFKEIEKFKMPNGWTAHLVRRIKSLNFNDMHALITKLDVPEHMKEELLGIARRVNLPAL